MDFYFASLRLKYFRLHNWHIGASEAAFHLLILYLHGLLDCFVDLSEAYCMGHLLQDTEAVLILKLSGILVKGDSGSRRFIVEKDRETQRKREKTEGHEDGGKGKTSSKGGKKYTKFKNSFMKTRSRKE